MPKLLLAAACAATLLAPGLAAAGCACDTPQPLAERLFLSPSSPYPGAPLRPVYVPPQIAYLGSSALRPASAERADWYAARMFYFNGRYFERPDIFVIQGN
jgi:hypothetical protein